MKSLLRKIITQILARKAKDYLKKHHTQVIGITGSIGKTSTKEAIYVILKDHFNVFRSKKSFNTEIGISLSILQEDESGFTSVKKWFQILRRAFMEPKMIYQKMILEMGADQPGDIKRLKKIAQPNLAIVTNIAPVHLAEGQFKDIYDIAKEKSKIIQNLPRNGVAVLNYDDPLIREMDTDAEKLTYGVESAAMVRAQNINVTTKHIEFTVHYRNQSQEFKVPVIGKFQVFVLLPAIAVAIKLGMELKECADSLAKYNLPPGRMNPIEGKEKTTIIDSSYNASPVTMEKALDLLNDVKADRKIAALGTMNELGEMTKEAHIASGRQAAQVADLLIAVGQEATTYKQGAMEGGMREDQIYTFFDSEEAGHFLENRLQPKDLILVKGSQNRIRMEKLVKVIMKKPDQARTLLCRQGDDWDRI